MKIFAFDFETFLIQPYMLAPPLVCMSYAIDDEEPELVHVLDRRLRAMLYKALTTPGCVMVAHNAAFEAVCIMAAFPEFRDLLKEKLDKGEFYCTMLGERLISIGKGDHWKEFGLDDCVARHQSSISYLMRKEKRQPTDAEFAFLSIVVDKECWWRLRYGLLCTTPCELWTAEAFNYAILDAHVARELYKRQTGPAYWKFTQDNVSRYVRVQRIRDGHYDEVHVPGQTWYSVSLMLTSCTGFPTDPVMAEALYEETVIRMASYEAELKRVGFLMPKREKGRLKYTLKKEPAERLMIQAFKAMGREAPRGGVTPTMLVKAYAKAGITNDDGTAITWEESGNRKTKVVPDEEVEQAIEMGVPREALLGNIKLDEDACLKSQHPLLLAYTRYGQAKGLLNKVRRLRYPLIQTRYNALVETGRTSSSQGDDPKPMEAWTQYGMQIQNLPCAGEEVEEDNK